MDKEDIKYLFRIFVDVLIVTIGGIFLTYALTTSLNPQPKLKLSCDLEGKWHNLEISNIGKSTAENVLIYVQSKDNSCIISSSVLITYLLGSAIGEDTKIGWYPIPVGKQNNYTYETLLTVEFLPPINGKTYFNRIIL